MSIQRVASRYAKSLHDIAVERNELEDVYKDIKDFAVLVEENRDFELLLKSPIIRPDKKQAIFKALFENKLQQVTYEFFKIVIRKGREAFLSAICEEFVDMYNVDHHISKVRLTTAATLDEESVQALLDKLKSTGEIEENIDLEHVIDESLIGGYVVEFNHKLYDASVARQLELMKKTFSKNTYIKTY